MLGHAPWEDYVPDRAERAMWYRFDEPPVLDDGRLDPLALVHPPGVQLADLPHIDGRRFS